MNTDQLKISAFDEAKVVKSVLHVAIYMLQTFTSQMLTEADTCRKYVVPMLQGDGWDNDPHSIAEQRFFTDGRIIVRGSQATVGFLKMPPISQHGTTVNDAALYGRLREEFEP